MVEVEGRGLGREWIGEGKKDGDFLKVGRDWVDPCNDPSLPFGFSFSFQCASSVPFSYNSLPSKPRTRILGAEGKEDGSMECGMILLLWSSHRPIRLDLKMEL